MLALRKKHNDLFAYGQFEMLDKKADKTIVWLKHTEEEDDKQALVVLNFSKDKVEWSPPKSKLKGDLKLVVGNYTDSKEGILEPYEGRLYFLNV